MMAGADPPDLKRAGRTSEAAIGAPQGGGTDRSSRRTGGTRFLSLFGTLFFELESASPENLVV